MSAWKENISAAGDESKVLWKEEEVWREEGDVSQKRRNERDDLIYVATEIFKAPAGENYKPLLKKGMRNARPKHFYKQFHQSTEGQRKNEVGPSSSSPSASTLLLLAGELRDELLICYYTVLILHPVTVNFSLCYLFFLSFLAPVCLHVSLSPSSVGWMREKFN